MKPVSHLRVAWLMFPDVCCYVSERHGAVLNRRAVGHSGCLRVEAWSWAGGSVFLVVGAGGRRASGVEVEGLVSGGCLTLRSR